MANSMTETFFLQHKNTEIEIGLENKDKIRITFGNHFLFVTPTEADTLAQMLSDAAEGKGKGGAAGPRLGTRSRPGHAHCAQ